MTIPIGTFTDYQSFVALLRARKDELGLSNLQLDHLAGLTDGRVDKVLGPTQTKGIGPLAFGALLDALGLSGTLYADPGKAVGPADRRRDRYIRENCKVAKEAIARARPLVMAELARKGGAARWAGSTPGSPGRHDRQNELSTACEASSRHERMTRTSALIAFRSINPAAISHRLGSATDRWRCQPDISCTSISTRLPPHPSGGSLVTIGPGTRRQGQFFFFLNSPARKE